MSNNGDLTSPSAPKYSGAPIPGSMAVKSLLFRRVRPSKAHLTARSRTFPSVGCLLARLDPIAPSSAGATTRLAPPPAPLCRSLPGAATRAAWAWMVLLHARRAQLVRPQVASRRSLPEARMPAACRPMAPSPAGATGAVSVELVHRRVSLRRSPPDGGTHAASCPMALSPAGEEHQASPIAARPTHRQEPSAKSHAVTARHMAITPAA